MGKTVVKWQGISEVAGKTYRFCVFARAGYGAGIFLYTVDYTVD
jgi:hypothetical protein